SNPIDMPQKRMSPSGGDTISATVLRYTDHAICRQLCSPSARSSSMTVCRYMPTSAHWGGPRSRSMEQNRAAGAPKQSQFGGSGPLARLHVLARNTEFAVTLLAEGLAALAVRGLQCGRVHLVLPLVPGVACGHARAGALLELGQRRAG